MQQNPALWSHRPLVGGWLLVLAAMILVNVSLGGLTRLTGSGLSMVEWQPFTLLPPMDHAAWQLLWDKYQQTPQFRLVNAEMTLAGFQRIFWLEYVHRLWGRLLGVAFLLPFVGFVLTGRLGRREVPTLALLFVTGALQGLLGWAMVKSGLADRPEVSHYRLAAHLCLALALYAALLWTGANRLKPPQAVAPERLGALRTRLALLLGLLALTIPMGALVAGLHAGLIYNDFPLMGGRLLAEDAFALQPWWLNLVANPSLVQFDHRLLATLAWLTAMTLLPALTVSALPARLRWGLAVVPALACLQWALGIATLRSLVPIGLAAAHQLTAFLLFGAALWNFHQVRRSGAPAR